jgi:hypothetical protein
MSATKDLVMDEELAAEQLCDLVGHYGVLTSPLAIMRLISERWATLSKLAHAIHNAQARARRSPPDELYSPEYETASG